MKFEFRKSNSTIKPPVIDKISSATGVYYRKNITEKKDEDGNISYDYDEILMPNDFRFEIEDAEIYAAKLDEIIESNNNGIKQKRINEILKELDSIDTKTIRALRENEPDRLNELENKAIKLRAEMWELQK